MATDPVLPSTAGTGALPGAADASSPLLPGSEAAPAMPAAENPLEDPTPGERPVLPDGPDPA